MTVLAVFGAIALLGLACVLLYNGLVRGKNAVEEGWSGIDVQLRRRHDLVPNLVTVVQQYAAHEKTLFESVSEARAMAMAAGSNVEAAGKAESALGGALRGLLAIAEAYPALRASENFVDLQQQLGQLEDELQMARRYYNGTARDQNNRVLQFPGNLVANAFHFEKVAYFELDDAAAREAPQVGKLLS